MIKLIFLRPLFEWKWAAPMYSEYTPTRAFRVHFECVPSARYLELISRDTESEYKFVSKLPPISGKYPVYSNLGPFVFSVDTRDLSRWIFKKISVRITYLFLSFLCWELRVLSPINITNCANPRCIMLKFYQIDETIRKLGIRICISDLVLESY